MTETEIRQQIHDDIMAVAAVYSGLVFAWGAGLRMAAQIALHGKADDNRGATIGSQATPE